MFFLLLMALVGDLIFLPALLAGPLGKYFGKERPKTEATGDQDPAVEPTLRLIGEEPGAEIAQENASKPEVVLPDQDRDTDIRRVD